MSLIKNKQYYYWNEKTVYPWLKYDEYMNEKFSHVTKILFENINIKKNQLVLDIGCGSGFTSYQCAKKVGINAYLLNKEDSIIRLVPDIIQSELHK